MSGIQALARMYRRFGGIDAAGKSSLYERVAVALSGSEEALRAIGAVPARRRHPRVILTALHDLALAGRAPALAAAHAAMDGDAAAGAAIDTLLHMTDEVVAIAVRRRVRTDETGRHAVLYPAIAEAAAGRPVAWVPAEGVGVAPTIPTLGDRPASGHSIIGLAILDRSAPREVTAEAPGRCRSRGRMVAWTANPGSADPGP